jgi:sulfur-oxidizing protein SoxZ
MAKQKPMKIRAVQKGNRADVKVLMFHPMETGLRKDKKTGEVIPAHFIKNVTVEHNGNEVMTADMGIAISKNPFLSFRVSNSQSGDTVKISWEDNLGESDSKETKIR